MVFPDVLVANDISGYLKDSIDVHACCYIRCCSERYESIPMNYPWRKGEKLAPILTKVGADRGKQRSPNRIHQFGCSKLWLHNQHVPLDIALAAYGVKFTGANEGIALDSESLSS